MTQKAIEAFENLINMHMAEQEGIGSGMPSPDDWIKAVGDAAEALESLRQGGWKSMDSAPRDRFILATPCFGTSTEPYQVYWYQGKCKSGWKFADTFLTATPTHWQPLPPPPEGE